MKELAPFLRCAPGELGRFLKKRGLLRFTYPGPCRAAVRWTTARGVALAVAHFRAKQGARYQRGEDPLREMDAKNAWARRRALGGG